MQQKDYLLIIYNDGVAIINSDSDYAIKLADICRARAIKCFFYVKANDLKLLSSNNDSKYSL